MSERNTIEVGLVYRRKGEEKYELIFPDFFSSSSSGWQRAPPFRCFNADWVLQAKSAFGCPYFQVSRRGKAAEPVRFTVAIKADGSEVPLSHDQRFANGASVWYSPLIRNELFQLNWGKLELSPSTGAVTFTITIFLEEPSRQSFKNRKGKQPASRETEEELAVAVRGTCGGKLDITVDPSLQKHLKDLLLSGNDHDFTIIVENEEYKVHKGMLRVRSPVFEAMFNQDAEGAGSSISLNDCDNSFPDFLLYVYTGIVEGLSPEKAVGLYYSAHKFEFPCLKEVCVQFLKTSLSKTSICDVISLAKTYGERDLLEKAKSYFCENALEILMTEEWKKFVAKDFDTANDLYIEAYSALGKKVNK